MLEEPFKLVVIMEEVTGEECGERSLWKEHELSTFGSGVLQEIDQALESRGAFRVTVDSANLGCCHFQCSRHIRVLLILSMGWEDE